MDYLYEICTYNITMASIRFYIAAKQMDLARVFLRLSVPGTGDFLGYTGETVMRDTWDNKRGSFIEGIRLSQYDNDLLDRLWSMRRYLLDQYRQHPSEVSKVWLAAKIRQFREAYATTGTIPVRRPQQGVLNLPVQKVNISVDKDEQGNFDPAAESGKLRTD